MRAAGVSTGCCSRLGATTACRHAAASGSRRLRCNTSANDLATPTSTPSDVQYCEEEHTTYMGERFFKYRLASPQPARQNAESSNSSGSGASNGSDNTVDSILPIDSGAATDVGSTSLCLRAINHISVSADDVEALTQFYTSVLGFRRLERPNFPFSGTWLFGANVTMHVIASDPTVPKPEGIAEKREPWHERRGRHIAFEVDSLPEAEAVLRHHGVEYDKFPIPGFPGVYQIFFLDPEGHGVELGRAVDYHQISEKLLTKQVQQVQQEG